MIECEGVRHVARATAGLEVPPLAPHRVANESRNVAGFLVISQPPAQHDREGVPGA